MGKKGDKDKKKSLLSFQPEAIIFLKKTMKNKNQFLSYLVLKVTGILVGDGEEEESTEG